MLGATAYAEDLSPVALAADATRGLLYVAEYTACRIAVFDASAQRVSRTIVVPDRPSGLALSADGSHLYVTGGGAAGRLWIVETASGAVSGTVAVGHTPIAPVVEPDGKNLYVANRFSTSVSVIDLAKRMEVVRIAAVREPFAATMAGNRLFVANLLPFGASNSGNVAAEVSVIDARTRRAVARVRLPDGSSGVRGIAASPDGQFVYVTHTLGRYQLPTSQIEGGWIQTNALSIIESGKAQLLNTVLLDDINMGAANPWAVMCSSDGRQLVVSHAGTHEVSLIDRAAMHHKLEEAARRKVTDVSTSAAEVKNDMTFLTGIRMRVPLQGNGPRSLAAIGGTIYAGEYFSDSLAVLEPGAGARSVALGVPEPQSVQRRGEMLFYDAQYCLQKWLSCSSCHPGDGRPDGLNWDLMLDGVGNAKNTKSLLLSHQTPPTTATGARPNAEASVRNGYLNIEFADRPDEDASAIDAFLKSLRPEPSPYLVNGGLGAAAVRGKKVFEDTGCGSCHSGPLYTGLGLHRVGSGRGREKDTPFDTPTLIEVWRSAPYFHDGRAATLQELFSAPDNGPVHSLNSRLKKSQLDDLVAFVLSL